MGSWSKLIYYIDNRTSLEKANDGLLYADEVLQDCSVLMLNLLTFDPASTTSNKGQVHISSPPLSVQVDCIGDDRV